MEASTLAAGAHWDERLLEKYDVRGPRYTSYPGAHMFRSDIDHDHYSRYIQDRASSPEALGLYVHIPFCSNICYYCACNKIVTRDKSQSRVYLHYLKKEMALLDSFGIDREVTALHLGGGSPNFLEAEELTELIYQLSARFNFSSGASREFSIEIDPQTVSADAIRLMAGLGFNRLSMGIQDFDPQVQKAVNRWQTESKVARLAEIAREQGFGSINYDLIYGLPFQSVDSFTTTIKRVLSHQPDQIALYNYAHLPDRFPTQRSIDRLTLPKPEEKLRLLCSTAELLQDNGYRYMGMDHFVREGSDIDRAARAGQLCRGFQGYSIQHAPETIGLGMSAISSLDNAFYQNHRELGDYYAALDAGRLPLAKGLMLSTDDQIRARVIHSLICELGVDKREIAAEFDIDFDEYFAVELDRLVTAEEDGLLCNTENALQVTEQGRILLRNLCMIFDSTLSKSETIFSKTV